MHQRAQALALREKRTKTQNAKLFASEQRKGTAETQLQSEKKEGEDTNSDEYKESLPFVAFIWNDNEAYS